MTPFSLKVVTPDGLIYDGQAEEIVVRTTSGDMGILAGHIDCVAPLGMGAAMILSEGKKRYAACIGGILSVSGGNVTLVPTTFEWADSIDMARAERSQARAESVLEKKDATRTEVELAQARLKRALIRKNVGSTFRR
jgi:F-type H+-transporting ATPase subunit epsilon